MDHPTTGNSAIPLFISALSGLLLAAASPPAFAPITALPSVLGLFWALRILPAHNDATWPIFVYLLVGWGASYPWILTHVWAQTAFVSVLLVTCLALVGALLGRFGNNQAGAYGLATALMLFEAVLTFGPLPMPLISAGYSVSGTTWSVLAPLLGITGISFLIWCMGAWVSQRQVSVQVGALLVWVFVAASGMEVQRGNSPSPVEPPIPFVIVQPGTAPETWADIHSDERVNKLKALSGESDGIWIWPETSLPVGSMARQDSLLRRAGAPDLISGAILISEFSGQNYKMHNAAVYWRPSHRADQKPLLWSGKRRLIPLVEYIPGLEWVPWLSHFRVDSGGAEGYTPGGPRPVWDVRGRRVSVLICFESLFAGEARVAARKGAEMIVVLSQDGWWNSTRMPLQHRDMTALVAQATGRTVVMDGVSGWSGVLSETGAVVDELAIGVSGVLRTNVRPRPVRTLYLAAGESFSVLFFLFGVYMSSRSVWIRHD